MVINETAHSANATPEIRGRPHRGRQHRVKPGTQKNHPKILARGTRGLGKYCFLTHFPNKIPQVFVVVLPKSLGK